MSSERSVKDVFGPYTAFMERAMGIEPTSKAWEAYDITQKHAGLAAFLQFPERLNWKIVENGKQVCSEPDETVDSLLRRDAQVLVGQTIPARPVIRQRSIQGESPFWASE